VDRAVEAGMLQQVAGASGRFRPTPHGSRFLNDLLVDFLPSGTGT
jgi:hypothetical protein